MRERLLEMARRSTKAEAVAAIEQAWADADVSDSASSIVADVSADRR
ncbi:MAG: hypothetical protein ICV70_05235 [Jiangellaceae bacterium]|nr:hypothetical protein [Jiangellaceae bacterium]